MHTFNTNANCGIWFFVYQIIRLKWNYLNTFFSSFSLSLTLCRSFCKRNRLTHNNENLLKNHARKPKCIEFWFCWFFFLNTLIAIVYKQQFIHVIMIIKSISFVFYRYLLLLFFFLILYSIRSKIVDLSPAISDAYGLNSVWFRGKWQRNSINSVAKMNRSKKQWICDINVSIAVIYKIFILCSSILHARTFQSMSVHF